SRESGPSGVHGPRLLLPSSLISSRASPVLPSALRPSPSALLPAVFLFAFRICLVLRISHFGFPRRHLAPSDVAGGKIEIRNKCEVRNSKRREIRSGAAVRQSSILNLQSSIRQPSCPPLSALCTRPSALCPPPCRPARGAPGTHCVWPE